MKTTTKTDKRTADAGGSQPRPRDQGHDRTSQRFAAWSMAPAMTCASQTNDAIHDMCVADELLNEILNET